MTDPDKADALATERWQYIAPLVEGTIQSVCVKCGHQTMTRPTSPTRGSEPTRR